MLKIRTAEISDVPQILAYVRELAEYERQPDAVLATEADFIREGFGPQKRYDCLMAEWNGEPVGFALWFYNFSTWRGRSGIHLEDLFVRPAHRGKGIGKALLTRVAAVAVEQKCARLQWDVLDWNVTAIGFYEQIGATMMHEWRMMRVTDDALLKMAALAEKE